MPDGLQPSTSPSSRPTFAPPLCNTHVPTLTHGARTLDLLSTSSATPHPPRAPSPARQTTTAR
ncbi:hypothetical protein PsYK624_170890 [Phanerochaete sordida]|uniref:Uncharacterized protein n=1 Tax=Phanerochaete sordida TaxID=48140 RepID=A0A9P3GRY8_9APHY|nr:hypothetical protein PsYK624_170890 [Phanerochaete sordida]